MKSNYRASLALVPLFVIVSLITYNCHAQDFILGAGANTTKYTDVDFDLGEALGYYVQVGVEGKLTNTLGYGGTLQMNNYRYDKISFYSLDPAFYFKLYPAQEGFSFLGGVQLTNIFHVRFDGDRVETNNSELLAWLVGASVDFNKIQVVAKYISAFTGEGFDYTLQVGLNYRFSKD